MKGQTTLDFAIGISVFLVVIIFIFSFAPGILSPFTVTGQSDAVTVDRVADQLSQDTLGSPDRPHLLDRGCTVSFFDREFNETPVLADQCRYGDAPLNDQVGLSEPMSVNVTLTGNLSGGSESVQLYWDSDDRTLVDDSESGDVRLAIGDEPDERRATTTATRVVRLHGEDVTLRVVVF